MKQALLRRLYHRTLRMEGSHYIHTFRGMFVLFTLVLLLYVVCLVKQALWLYSYCRAFMSGHHTFADMAIYQTIAFVALTICRMWKMGSRLTVLFWFTYCTVIIRRQVDSFARNPVVDEQIQEQPWNHNQIHSLQFEGTNVAVSQLNLIKSSMNELRRHSWILSAIILLELTSLIGLLLQVHTQLQDFEDWVLAAREGIEASAVAVGIVAVTFAISALNTAVASLPGQLRRDQTGKILPYNIVRLEQELRDVRLQFHPTGLQLSSGSFGLIMLTVLSGLVSVFGYFGLGDTSNTTCPPPIAH